jgi:hypothetical protein
VVLNETRPTRLPTLAFTSQTPPAERVA